MSVAIVGAGVSGLTAAYALQPGPRGPAVRGRDAASAGTSRPCPSRRRPGPLPVDTGFIVYNERTYPRFTGLLAELGVETQPSDMSLGSACHACDVEFSSRGCRRLLRPPRRLRPAGPLADDRGHPAVLPRRTRTARHADAPSRETLGDYLDDRGFGSGFRDHFLVPITSAVWSTAPDRILDFPVDYLLHFLDNHGLIGVGRALQWRTVTRRFDGVREAHRRARSPRGRCGPVTRSSASCATTSGSRSARRPARPNAFDAVVMATHADDALAVLHDADTRERAALGAFEYSTNQVVLHTDRAAHAAPTPAPGHRGMSTRRTAGDPATRSR